MSALLAALRTVPARFFRDQGFLLASAISFAALLCLAPLVLILFSLAGYLMESDKIADYLFDAATVLLPAYGRELGEFFSFLTRERAVAGLVGVLSWGIFTTQFFLGDPHGREPGVPRAREAWPGARLCRGSAHGGHRWLTRDHLHRRDLRGRDAR